MGHRDIATTQRYADYTPNEREVELTSCTAVLITPSDTAFTRTPREVYSIASDLVAATRPPGQNGQGGWSTAVRLRGAGDDRDLPSLHSVEGIIRRDRSRRVERADLDFCSERGECVRGSSVEEASVATSARRVRPRFRQRTVAVWRAQRSVRPTAIAPRSRLLFRRVGARGSIEGWVRPKRSALSLPLLPVDCPVAAGQRPPTSRPLSCEGRGGESPAIPPHKGWRTTLHRSRSRLSGGADTPRGSASHRPRETGCPAMRPARRGRAQPRPLERPQSHRPQ